MSLRRPRAPGADRGAPWPRAAGKQGALEWFAAQHGRTAIHSVPGEGCTVSDGRAQRVGIACYRRSARMLLMGADHGVANRALGTFMLTATRP